MRRSGLVIIFSTPLLHSALHAVHSEVSVKTYTELQSVVAGGKASSKNGAIQEARKIDGIRIISSIDEGRTTKL